MCFSKFPPSRILVMKLRHMGDTLLMTPVLTALHEAFPEGQIDLYVWKESKSIVAHNPLVSKIHLFDRTVKKRSWFFRVYAEMALWKAIISRKYDLVINLTEGDRGLIAAILSRAGTRIGFRSDSRKGFFGSFIEKKGYTHLVKRCPTDRHEVERNLDALRVLQIPVGDKKLSFSMCVASYTQVDQQMREWGLQPQGYVVMHPCARWMFKALSPLVVARLLHRIDRPILLTGGVFERAKIEEILQLYNQLGKTHSESIRSIYNLAGKTSIEELGRWIERAQAIITVDSLTLHIASALTVPTVAIFGPTSEKNWGPWKNPKSCVVALDYSCRPCRLDGCGGSKRSACLEELNPDMIMKGLERVLAKISLPVS